MAIPSLTSIRTWVYNVLSGPILLIKVTNGKRRLRQDAHARVRLHPIPCQGGPCGQHAHTLTGAHGEPHTPAPLLALLCPLYRAQACVDDRACLRSQGCSHLGCTQENGGPQGGGHGVRCLQQPHREHPGPAVRCGDGQRESRGRAGGGCGRQQHQRGRAGGSRGEPGVCSECGMNGVACPLSLAFHSVTVCGMPAGAAQSEHSTLTKMGRA